MASKKALSLIPGQGGATNISSAAAKVDLNSILSNADLSASQKRKSYFTQLGIAKPKKKYASPAERKAAAKERAKQRRAERINMLPEALRPKPRGPKLSPEQKREKRSARRHAKRDFLHEMARANPEAAQRFGINPGRFKI